MNRIALHHITIAVTVSIYRSLDGLLICTAANFQALRHEPFYDENKDKICNYL